MLAGIQTNYGPTLSVDILDEWKKKGATRLSGRSVAQRDELANDQMEWGGVE
ncbi:hypothetical protein WUBG_03847 [Wuchereria bancrofti]|uniref:Uncharacterized protein n=1 Tax=Wuchereria bancrofti TaxID=6293 RepID=J9ERT2_WUCBA|nr:hypothetical protein WUBG_03847 [Wuchereria bancrofti]